MNQEIMDGKSISWVRSMEVIIPNSAERGGCFQRRLFVCEHDNFRIDQT